MRMPRPMLRHRAADAGRRLPPIAIPHCPIRRVDREVALGVCNIHAPGSVKRRELHPFFYIALGVCNKRRLSNSADLGVWHEPLVPLTCLRRAIF